MALLIDLVADPAGRSRLQSAVEAGKGRGAVHRVMHAGSWPEAFSLARRNPADLLVFDPYMAGELALEPPRRFRCAFPSVALLPYGDFPGGHARDVLRLARIGVSTLAVRGEDDHPHRLETLIAEALTSSLADTILPELRDLVPAPLLTVVRHVVCEAYRPVAPLELARLYCRHGKTLREHLNRAGLPPTHKLVVWGRLFHAAFLLEDRARTVANVAATLDYPSPSALRHQIQRYAGVPLKRVRSGGVRLMLERFRWSHARADWSTHGAGTTRAATPAEEGAQS